VYNYI